MSRAVPERRLCQHVRVTRPAVLFGGPSPEHDISVLDRAAGRRPPSRKDGVDVTAIYWAGRATSSRSTPASTPRPSSRVCPRGAHATRSRRSTRRRLRARGRAARPAGAARRSRAVVNCCHGGPGEDGTLQAALDLAGVALHRSDGGGRGARHGQARVRRSDARRRASPRLPRQAFDGRWASARFPRPVHREAPLRRLEHRHRDHRRSGRGRGSRPRLAPLPRRSGDRALPHRRGRPERRGAHPSRAPALGHRASAADGRARPASTPTPTSTSAGRAWRARSGSCRRRCPKPSRARSATRPGAVVAVALVRSVARIDFLLVGDEVFVNEINTIPGLTGLVLLGGRGACRSRRCSRGCSPRPCRARLPSTRPMGPTAPRSGRGVHRREARLTR